MARHCFSRVTWWCKVVLTISIYHKMAEIFINKLEQICPNKLSHHVQFNLAQHIVVSKTKEQPGSIATTPSAPLLTPFEDLFLRPPCRDEGNIVFTHKGLRDIAGLIWHMQHIDAHNWLVSFGRKVFLPRMPLAYNVELRYVGTENHDGFKIGQEREPCNRDPFIRYLENVRQGRRPIPFPLLSANPRLCNPQGKRGNLHRNTTDQLGGETGPVFIGVDYGLGNISWQC